MESIEESVRLQAMKGDVRDTQLYREAEAIYVALRGPGTGQICDASEVHASPDGRYAVFSGVLFDTLEGSPPTRICQVDLETGLTRVLTFGPNVDRLPRYSPDGRDVAFLSDRKAAGDFQLYLLDPVTGAVRPGGQVIGWVEYLHWSPDGTRILLGVAGHGADVAGGQGAIRSKQAVAAVPSWVPKVDSADESFRWRRAWIYDLASERVLQVSDDTSNVWEAVWCGNAEIAAVLSPGPGEGLWYGARLHVLDLQSGTGRELFKPSDQIGWPAASPAGKTVAIVEAVCSDRWLVAGDLRLVDTKSGEVRQIDTRGVDVSYAEWRSETLLLLAGHRGFETVVAFFDMASNHLTEVWSSDERTTGGIYVTVAGLNESGDCVLIGESFTLAPEVAVIRRGTYETVRSFRLGHADAPTPIGSVERVRWTAPDNLAIQGWLLLPEGTGPFPLVMEVHGGPVWHWRPRWLGRSGVHTWMLVNRGYAVFLPNPRGSSGRGQSFASQVKGDLNGADSFDLLSGLDYLVGRGIADPGRIGITGGSYGGNMTSWLITQDSRFAAAVPVAPHTNQVSEHLVSNIPHFVSLFLADHYTNPGGRYFGRSPVMHAHKAKTPTMNICGALDRCTPPEEAMQFHNALLENGVVSVLVTYPEEGHGIRKLPAAIDYACRVVSWFETYMPSSRG